MKVERGDLQRFYSETIFKFYRMGLATQGKTFDDVLFDDRGEKFWSEKNVHCRLFGKKLSQLLNDKRKE